MDLNYLQSSYFSEKEYEKYIDRWLNGISREIHFWNKWFDRKDSKWKMDFESEIANFNEKFKLDRFLY